MAMFRTVCVTLACALVLVDCTIIFKRDENCEALVACQTPLTDFVLENSDLPTNFGISNAEALDVFCEKVETASACVNSVGTSCATEAVIAEVAGTEAAVSHICTEEGRAETLGLAESVCLRDETKQLEVNEGIQSCVDKFEFDVLMLTIGAVNENRHLDPTELCPFTDAWVECTIHVAKDKCGEAYGNFLQKVLSSTAGEQFESLGCYNSFNKKRTMVKRFFPMGRKRMPY